MQMHDRGGHRQQKDWHGQQGKMGQGQFFNNNNNNMQQRNQRSQNNQQVQQKLFQIQQAEAELLAKRQLLVNLQLQAQVVNPDPIQESQRQ